MNNRFTLQVDSHIFPVIVGLFLLSSILSTTSGFAQSSTCPDGSAPDENGNCDSTTAPTETAPRIAGPPTSREDSPQHHGSPVQTPTSGAESVESGPQGCPPGYHKDPIEPVCLPDPPQPQPCPDGSTLDADGKCATVDPQPQPCPDGSTPDADGKCVSTPAETCPDDSLTVNGICITNTLLLGGAVIIGVVAAVAIIVKLRGRSRPPSPENIIEIKTEGGLE